MGMFNSLFWAIYMGSTLIGDLFGAFVIVKVNETLFYAIMTALSILSSLFFLLLKTPIKVGDKPEAKQVSVSSVLKLMTTKRMLQATPLMVTSGLCLAGNAGVFVPLLEQTMDSQSNWDEDVKSQKALIALSVLGLGEIIGAVVYGKILDRFGHKLTMYLCLLELLLAVGFNIWYIAKFKFDMWSASLMCFLWGVQEAGVGVFLQCIMGFEFQSKTTTFAIRNLVQSLTVFAALFLDSLLKNQTAFIWYTVAVGLWSTMSWLLMIAKFEFVAKKDKDSDNFVEATQGED
jgi:predicted MFS family arabinose efflux permease